MPSPAAAGVIASTVYLYPYGLQEREAALPALAMVLVPGFLMVSTIRFRSVKAIDVGWTRSVFQAVPRRRGARARRPPPPLRARRPLVHLHRRSAHRLGLHAAAPPPQRARGGRGSLTGPSHRHHSVAQARPSGRTRYDERSTRGREKVSPVGLSTNDARAARAHGMPKPVEHPRRESASSGNHDTWITAACWQTPASRCACLECARVKRDTGDRPQVTLHLVLDSSNLRRSTSVRSDSPMSDAERSRRGWEGIAALVRLAISPDLAAGENRIDHGRAATFARFDFDGPAVQFDVAPGDGRPSPVPVVLVEK